MDNTFYALSGKWMKSTFGKGGLKSLSFVKPQIHAGVKHAVLNEDKILPTNLGVLEVSVRVIGDLPSRRRLQCYIKFEWGIQSQFHVQHYKEGTFQVFFTSISDYLRGVNRAWGFIDDCTVVISQGPPELLFEEKFKNLPQWMLNWFEGYDVVQRRS